MSEEPEPAPDLQQEKGGLSLLGIDSPKRIVVFLACLGTALAVAAWLPNPGELELPARRALFILVFAGSLWVTEAIPAFSTGILVIALQVGLLGSERGGAKTPRDWENFVAVLGHPLVWLFFGGFVLAAGMARTGLDRWLASMILSRFGSRPKSILLGVMSITFVLSMFMSNTATTAMMLAMIAPLVASLDRDDRFGPGLVLGVAVAANVGGMGSLIGTPPNAIAVGVLDELGTSIGFLQWIAIGSPIAVVLLGLSWFLIARWYPSQQCPLVVRWDEDIETDARPWEQITVGLALVLTIGLWLTSGWHGIPTAAVSFLGIVLLTTTGILGAQEIRTLNWDVLFLLAGGLALGQVVSSTGLSTWIVAQLPLAGMGTLGIALVIAYTTVVMSNLMSNTAAANILIPLGVGLAVGSEAQIALPIALAASAAMMLPIATPPNAMAYATERLTTRDFVRIGLVLGLVAPLLAVAWIWLMGNRLFP